MMGHGSGRTSPPMEHVEWDKLHLLPTLDAIEQEIGFQVPALRRMAEHDCEDEYWEGLDQWRMHPKIRVPGMHAAGWFDHVSSGQFEAYQRIRDYGATEEARTGQRLLVGPWGHISLIQTGDTHRRYGIWDFGEAADFGIELLPG